jgi:hypothetical protein
MEVYGNPSIFLVNTVSSGIPTFIFLSADSIITGTSNFHALLATLIVVFPCTDQSLRSIYHCLINSALIVAASSVPGIATSVHHHQGSHAGEYSPMCLSV